MQVLKQVSDYKDQVLANVSHDLRTPLSIVNFMTTKVQNKLKKINKQSFKNFYNLKEEILLDLKMSQINVEMLNNLINDILDYTRIKEGKIKLNKQKFSLKELL